MIHGLRSVLNIRGEGRRGSTAQSSQNRAPRAGKRNDGERRNRDGAGGHCGRARGVRAAVDGVPRPRDRAVRGGLDQRPVVFRR